MMVIMNTSKDADGAAAGPSQDGPTRWLNESERAAWLRLMAVVELLPRALDSQLRRESDLTSFEYQVLAMLSEATDRARLMTDLARSTNSTLPRLSHVISKLEARHLVRRQQAVSGGRSTDAVLTDAGWEAVVRAAPGHVATVRNYVLDALSPLQVEHLAEICGATLTRLDPTGKLTPMRNE
jgi:DNA-binding MarR family transcriptional regulator